MSKIPRFAAATVLGVGTFMAVEQGITINQYEANSVERVNECAKALGNSALISGVDFMHNCGSYRDDFTPTSVNSNGQGRSISFKLPNTTEFLTKELPAASVADQETVDNNANRRSERTYLAGFLGLVVGMFVIGSDKTKKLDAISVRHGKRTTPQVGEPQRAN